MKSIIIFGVVFLIVGAFVLKKKNIRLSVNNSAFLDLGQLIYPHHKEEFKTYYSLFLEKKSKFSEEYKDLIEEYGFDKINALQATYLFGDNKELLGYIDWRGEENEFEVENFVASQIGQENFNWTFAQELRESSDKENQRDGKFIIDLLKAVDQDLNKDNKKLLFFDLGFDAYVFIATPKATYDKVIDKAPHSFHGAERLKK